MWAQDVNIAAEMPSKSARSLLQHYLIAVINE